MLSVFAGIAAVWCMVVGEWAWVMGWSVGALTLGAHARLEAMEGHTHHCGHVEVS